MVSSPILPILTDEKIIELSKSSEGIKTLKERILKGQLKETQLRSYFWKIFLEVVPPYVDYAQWADRLAKLRKSYEETRDSISINPYDHDHDNDNDAGFVRVDTKNNPLSLDSDSVWNQYFEDNELLKEINQDVMRTYPENDFFRDKKIQQTLSTILFVFSKEHPDISYRQGMHELLSPMLFLLHKEALDYDSNEDSSSLAFFMDRNYIEHDCYLLFSQLMNNGLFWFKHAPQFTKKGSTKENDMSDIVAKCHFVQNVLLKKKDPELFQHLKKLNIEPQLYGLRWIRVLFSREFHLEDLFILWDGIFAYGRGLALVDHMALAMLLYIRDDLLQGDYMKCLRRLLNYPPVEDVLTFVYKSTQLINPQTITKTTAPKPFSTPPENPTTSNPPSSSPKSPGFSLQTLKNKITRGLSLEDEIQTQTIHAKDEEINKLKELIKQHTNSSSHMSQRLERLVYTLQKGITEHSGQLGHFEFLIEVVAELKQVQQVLVGLLEEKE